MAAYSNEIKVILLLENSTMRIRFIWLHFHIFKNAGSTIEWILKRNFSDSFQIIHEQGERGNISEEEIIKYLIEHPHINALSSHHFRYPRPEHSNLQFVDICFLRHPMDRLQSIYFHYRRATDDSEKSSFAKTMSLPEFLLWMIEVEPFNVINSQTCFMATGGKYFFPPSPLQLKVAMKRVAEVRFLGVVDRFDESLMAAQFFLRPILPTIGLSYTPQNISENWQMKLTEKLERMKDLCGGELFSRLSKMNQSDEKLWRYATNELNRRLQYVPSRQEH